MNYRNQILVGDCIERMREIPDCYVDSIVTDPPYGLTFMGKDWDRGVPGVAFWEAAFRVAKPGAYMLAFGGTRTYHRLTCAIEDAGWEIRDCIMWVYGSGFPKSLNLDGEREGWGTALKPAWEPIIMARKPLVGTVAANVAEFGTGAMNIDASRIATDPSVDDPRLGGNGTWGTENAAKNVYEGGYAGERVGSSALGRWPANLIHDGSDEVLSNFPQTQSGKPGVMRKGVNDGAAFGAESRKPGTQMTGFGDAGSAARFFYCAKASKQDRDEGLEEMPLRDVGESDGRNHSLNSKSRMENGVATGPKADSSKRRNHHPTVKPTELMRYLCRLITPPGGLILDPFTGSGSTGKAARLEGFNFLGIELSPEYAAIAEVRSAAPMHTTTQKTKPKPVNHAQLSLFTEDAA